MKSSKEDLRKRGYVEDDEIQEYSSLTSEELIDLMESEEAYKRTIAVRLLKDSSDIKQLNLVQLLLDALLKEKSLYTKIEICNVLEKGNSETLVQMFKYVGKIGRNQYTELPKEVSKKVSYALPRDIIARVIGRMDISVLSVLVEALGFYQVLVIREIIDAIGFLCFYNNIIDESAVIKELIKCCEKYKDDKIIRWKITIAFSAFNDELVYSKLQDIIENDMEDLIVKEAQRSYRLINERNS